MSEDGQLHVYLCCIHETNPKWTPEAVKEILDNFPTIDEYEIARDTYSPEDDEEKDSWWLRDLARFRPSYFTRITGY